VRGFALAPELGQKLLVKICKPFNGLPPPPLTVVAKAVTAVCALAGEGVTDTLSFWSPA
jgi:hypothetical protein